jgi:hypothetical protein
MLRLKEHDLVYLLNRQQRAEGPSVSWLSASLPAGRRGLRAHRYLGRIRGRRPGGIRRGLAQAGFQLADALLQGRILRPQSGIL